MRTLALLLCACGAPCLASSGLELVEPSPWACEAFADTADAATLALRAVPDPRFRRSAPEQDLRGWVLILEPGPSYIVLDGTGRRVGGHTDCPRRSMHVASGGPPRQSSLIHELAHAYQRCSATTGQKLASEDEDHAGWTAIGIVSTVDRFTSD